MSLAGRMTYLTHVSYSTAGYPDPKLFGHISTFLNCLPNLEHLHVHVGSLPATVIPAAADMRRFCARIYRAYQKITSIVRAKGTGGGNGQRLRRFDTSDNNWTLDLTTFITQELVGWVYKGTGCWEIHP